MFYYIWKGTVALHILVKYQFVAPVTQNSLYDGCVSLHNRCGVSWHEDHVSLDCRECGGYSLERPCPLCDGRCSNVWKRDLTMVS